TGRASRRTIRGQASNRSNSLYFPSITGKPRAGDGFARDCLLRHGHLAETGRGKPASGAGRITKGSGKTQRALRGDFASGPRDESCAQSRPVVAQARIQKTRQHTPAP